MATDVATSHPSPPTNELNAAEMGNGNNVVNVNGIPIQCNNNLNVRTINGITYVNGVEIPPGAPNFEVERNNDAAVDRRYEHALEFAFILSVIANFLSIFEACIFKEYMLAASILKCVIYTLMTIFFCAALCYREKLWIFISCIISTGVIIIFNIISIVLIFIDIPIFSGNRDPDYIALYIFELLADGILLCMCMILYNICRRTSKAKKEKGSKHVQEKQPQLDDQAKKSKKTQNLGLEGSKESVMSKQSQKQRSKETGDGKSKASKEAVSKQQQSQSKSREPIPKASSEAVASKKYHKHSKNHASGKSKSNKDESKQ